MTKDIKDTSMVTLTTMGHIFEIQYMEKKNCKSHIKKISKDEYIELQTGEIKEFNKTDKRSESINSLRQTFKKLRYLINANFQGKTNELFITLTYAQPDGKPITDKDKVYIDFKKFIKKLRYKYKDKTTIDFINILEPQETGSWHCHVLIKFNQLQYIYIDNKEITKIWGQGWTDTRRIENIDNVGAYLTAYMCDIELNEKTENKAYEDHTEVIERMVDGKSKKYIKGGRLKYYPTGTKLYRTSKGIIQPTREKMSYEKAKKIIGSPQPHYRKEYNIDTSEFQNTIIYEQYNKKRD